VELWWERTARQPDVWGVTARERSNFPRATATLLHQYTDVIDISSSDFLPTLLSLAVAGARRRGQKLMRTL